MPTPPQYPPTSGFITETVFGESPSAAPSSAQAPLVLSEGGDFQGSNGKGGRGHGGGEARPGELRGKVGFGILEPSKEEVVSLRKDRRELWQILAQSAGRCQKGKGVDPEVCASSASSRSQVFPPCQRACFPPREGEWVAVTLLKHPSARKPLGRGAALLLMAPTIVAGIKGF